MEIRKCPACSSSHYRVISSCNEKIELKAKEFQFWQPPYNINKCDECGLHFKSNVLSPEELSLYYANVDFNKWGYEKLYPPERIIRNYLLNRIAGKKILDFGCSEGRLLATLVGGNECYGYDLNLEALQVAKSNGISVFETYEQLINSQIQFDVIIMIDVFEHLLNPIEVIDNMQKLLKKGGEMIISTGFANAPAYLKKPAEFWYFLNPQHVCMLSNEFIRYVGSRNKMEVVFKKLTSHYDTSPWVKLRLYIVHYTYWCTLKFRKFSFLHGIFPFKKIFKWKLYPYFPVTKDHVVVALKNK
jgi:2-polyprenyl-3-methyl-5-hydroxy-6-metoxy-1,4-benzoquinol methylase